MSHLPMKKNYHNKPYHSRRRSKSSVSTSSNIKWIFLGMLLGLILAVILYSHHQSSIAKHPVKTVSSHHASHKSVHVRENNILGKKTEEPMKAEFEFYTMLPKMQVETSRNFKPL